MKLERIHELLLLSKSGELTEGQQAELDEVLASNKAMQDYGNEVDRIVKAVRDTPLARDVDPLVVRRIEHLAQESGTDSRRIDRRANPLILAQWGPAIVSAAAAVLLLFIGVNFIKKLQAPGSRQAANDVLPAPAVEPNVLAWDLDTDTELNDLDDYLALASADLEPGNASSEELDEVANELLILEGMSI